MNRSFYNGISGVKTQQFGIDVWGNNIANANLAGFKNSNPEFATQFSNLLDGQPISSTVTVNDIGLGSKSQGTALDLREGELQITDNTFDIALGAEGWFALKDKKNQIYYTRAGSFNIDKDGNLVTDNGMFLLGTSGENISPFSGSNKLINDFGKAYTDNGTKQVKIFSVKKKDNISLGPVKSQTKIVLPYNLYYPAVPTTNIKIATNLNPIEKKDASGNTIPNIEHISTDIISKDGTKKILDMLFTKKTNEPNHKNVWDGKIELLSFYEKYDKNKTYDTSHYKVDKQAEKVYKIEDTKDAQVSFSPYGALSDFTMPTIANDGINITIDIGKIGSYGGFTSIDVPTKLKNVIANGQKDGMLVKYRIDKNGQVIADFDNGRSTPVAKIAVYHFQNDQGLYKASATLLKQTDNSGEAFFYKDKSGNDLNTTPVLSHRLEASNTQMSTALTELLVMQKAFDANAKSITTSDQMIQKAINMKK